MDDKQRGVLSLEQDLRVAISAGSTTVQVLHSLAAVTHDLLNCWPPTLV